MCVGGPIAAMRQAGYRSSWLAACPSACPASIFALAPVVQVVAPAAIVAAAAPCSYAVFVIRIRIIPARRQVVVLSQMVGTSAGSATVSAAITAGAFTVTVALADIHPGHLWVKIFVLIAVQVAVL